MMKNEIIINGRVPSDLVKRWENIRQKKIENNSLVFFCDYSNFDIPIGAKFNSLQKDSHTIFSGIMTLKAITQEFLRPLDTIPKGWKTICQIEFNVLPNSLIHDIPVIKDWFDENHINIKMK